MNENRTILIEVTAERFTFWTYVSAVLGLSVFFIAVLTFTGTVGINDPLQWLPPLIFSLIAWWLYARNKTTLTIEKNSRGQLICSLKRKSGSMEEQFLSMDYWNTYKGNMQSHGLQLKVSKYLEVQTISHNYIRLRSDDHEEIIDKTLLRGKEFALSDRVYVVEDAGEIAEILKSNLTQSQLATAN
jgi:hypothetical protein